MACGSGFTFGNMTGSVTTAPQQQNSLFGTPATTAGFAVPATTTMFSFGTNTPTSSTSGSGVNFGAGSGQLQTQSGFSFGAQPRPTTATHASTASTSVMAGPHVQFIPHTSLIGPNTQNAVVSGLGGIPWGGNARMSTFAMGSNPTLGAGWVVNNENKAVQDLPVPPEIIALVENLKENMKKHKLAMQEITRATYSEIGSVSEKIEEIRSGVSSLSNVIHRQELITASLIQDTQEMSKEMDLLAQIRDVPPWGYGGTSALILAFLKELISKYSQRMLKYKEEIERAEFSLQNMIYSHTINSKDLWDSLTTIKDSVIVLAAKVQHLQEETRKELGAHKSFCQFIGNPTQPWLVNALSGKTDNIPPLQKVLANARPAISSTSLEAIYGRTYSMLGDFPLLPKSQVLSTPSFETIQNTPPNVQGASSSGQPSSVGSESLKKPKRVTFSGVE